MSGVLSERPYPLEMVPAWCGMMARDHLCLGGCWGILYGWVANGGEAYCRACDLYAPKAPEEEVRPCPPF